MWETIGAIHKALKIESTWAFVAVIAVIGGSLSGAAAWVIAVGYKNSADYKAEHFPKQQTVTVSNSASQPVTVKPAQGVQAQSSARQKSLAKTHKPKTANNPQAATLPQQRGGIVVGAGPVLIEHNWIEGGVKTIKNDHRPTDMPDDIQGAQVKNNRVTGTTAFENAGKAERIVVAGNILQPSTGQDTTIVKNDTGGEMKDVMAINNETKAASLHATTASLPHMGDKKSFQGADYIWIQPGTFMMGCSQEDNECLEAEKPRHLVELTKGFWIGETEVTQGQYRRLKAVEPLNNSDAADDNLPVVNVTWDEARKFCVWAGGVLPTEAQWEYAARGGSAGARYEGDLAEVAWYEKNSDNTTHHVGGKASNGYGLSDVLGNVLEWVNDWYTIYPAIAQTDPTGPKTGTERIVRGGSWMSPSKYVRLSNRRTVSELHRSGYIGFRCVLD